MPKKLNEKWLPDNNEGLLIGLVTSEKSFRVAWQVNLVFDIQLVKCGNFESGNDKVETHIHDVYKFSDEMMKRDFILLKNKYGNHTIIPTLKVYDYLLIIQGNVSLTEEEQWLSNITKNNLITLSKLLDLSQIDIQI